MYFDCSNVTAAWFLYQTNELMTYRNGMKFVFLLLPYFFYKKGCRNKLSFLTCRETWKLYLNHI